MRTIEAIQHVAGRLYEFYVVDWQSVLLSLAISIALVCAILLLELLFVPWQNSSLRRLKDNSASSRTDILAFFLVETNLSLFAGMAMFFGVTYLAQRQIIAVGAMFGPWHIGVSWVGIAVFIIINDLANYWTHRLCHEVPLLWKIHQYHHSAPQMTVLTAARDHPMERALGSMVSAVPAALLSTPTNDFFVLIILAKVVGLIKHSNIVCTWGWFGRYVIQSPGAHWIHHSIDPAHHNYNYASLFQFWDVLFGTAYQPKLYEVQRVVFGVDQDHGQTPAWRYLVQVYYEFVCNLFGKRDA